MNPTIYALRTKLSGNLQFKTIVMVNIRYLSVVFIMCFGKYNIFKYYISI